MKLKFLTLFSILALAASVFAESAMSNITVNLRYTGKNGAAKKFAEEMVSSGTVPKLRDKYDLKMTVERYMPDNTMPKTDEKFIRK